MVSVDEDTFHHGLSPVLGQASLPLAPALHPWEQRSRSALGPVLRVK